MKDALVCTKVIDRFGADQSISRIFSAMSTANSGRARIKMHSKRVTFLLLAGGLALAPAGTWAQPVQNPSAKFSAGFQQWRTPWSYRPGDNGPDHWAALDPEYRTCAAGKRQSPIDIRDTVKRKLPALQFTFVNGPVNIVNNGYAVRVEYKPGSGNSLTVAGKIYELTQFHFHHPGEEHVNGKPYDMVLHAMYQARDGEVAGVAVPLKRGNASATFAQLWARMPLTIGGYHEIEGFTFDPSGMLPKDTSYYRYDGSVSAPPCNEPVTWFVLKMPAELPAKEIGAYAKLFPHDVRPVQPLNGRIVLESE